MLEPMGFMQSVAAGVGRLGMGVRFINNTVSGHISWVKSRKKVFFAFEKQRMQKKRKKIRCKNG